MPNFSFMLYTFPILKVEKNDKLFQEDQSIPSEFAFIHVPWIKLIHCPALRNINRLALAEGKEFWK